MTFEYDPAKSISNKSKHGIDFLEGQALWEDEHRLEIDAESTTEPRLQVIGMIKNKLWSAFITYRGKNIRIISIRGARQEEKELYHGY